jgi:hypothetical protein
MKKAVQNCKRVEFKGFVIFTHTSIHRIETLTSSAFLASSPLGMARSSKSAKATIGIPLISSDPAVAKILRREASREVVVVVVAVCGRKHLDRLVSTEKDRQGTSSRAHNVRKPNAEKLLIIS